MLINKTTLFTILLLYGLFLSGCASRFSVSMFEEYEVLVPTEKAHSSASVIKNYSDGDVKEFYNFYSTNWNNDFIKFTSYFPEYETKLLIEDCRYPFNAGLTFLSILSLGVIPTYNKVVDCNLSMEIKNNDVILKQQVGKYEKTEWVGWLTLLIPDKTINSAFDDEKDEIISNISYQIYDSSSDLNRLKTEKAKKEKISMEKKKQENNKKLLKVDGELSDILQEIK